MAGKNKASWGKILKAIDKITKSKASVKSFFEKKNKDIPFSYSQYKRYVIHIKNNGRSLQPATRGHPELLGTEEKGFIKAACAYAKPSINELQTKIYNEYGIKISRSCLCKALDECVPGGHKNVILAAKDLQRKKNIVTSVNTCAGFELIVAVAIHLGWPKRAASLVAKSLKRMRKEFPVKKSDNELLSVDKKHRKDGRFTAKYNRRKDVRQQRFVSINNRRSNLNWYRSTINRDSGDTLERKVIAMLALPVISNNGKIRNLDLSGRQDLHHFTGRVCKQATISRFMTELKSLGTSSEFLNDLPLFWSDLWGNDLELFEKKGMLCFYIDGNVKPVWSHVRIKKGHVTMLGKVMGCLEQVFVHDVFGRPIYFETFSGSAPLNDYVQNAFRKIENCLDLKNHKLTVNRALVVDAGANGVETLKELGQDSSHYYITRLDSNQWKPWKKCGQQIKTRYRHGNAELVDGFIELLDSKKSTNNLFSTRFVKVCWDLLDSEQAQRESVLVTNFPMEMANSSDVVKMYFDRWPCQEIPFRKAKAVASLGRVAGYGKRIIENKEKESELEKLINDKKAMAITLKPYFDESMAIDSKISRISKKIVTIKKRTFITATGIRGGCKTDLKSLEVLEKKLKRSKRDQDKLKANYAKDIGKYERLHKKWKKLDTDLKTYTMDVELDQIVTYFRAILVHIYAYFLQRYLNGVKMDYESFVSRIIYTSGTIKEDGNTREVQLNRNDSDPDAMRAIEKAITVINNIGIKSMNNRNYYFSLI